MFGFLPSFGCSVVLKDLSSKQHAKQMHDTNSTIQVWSRGWCGFGLNRCYILEKEWTESEIIIIDGILKYAFSMGGVRAFDLTEFLPMQEKKSQSEKWSQSNVPKQVWLDFLAPNLWGLQPAFLIQSYSILRWFRYETELPWVLKGLSFSIQPGADLLMNKSCWFGWLGWDTHFDQKRCWGCWCCLGPATMPVWIKCNGKESCKQKNFNVCPPFSMGWPLAKRFASMKPA